MVDDLREDPEKRAALDRRVRNTQAQATPRRAQPPTAREQLLAELHQQAAQEEAQALEVAPEVGLAGPLAAEQETTNDPADADADGPDVPQWGADDEPAPAAAPAATAARSRPSPRVAMLCRPKAWPPLPPPLPATPWAAELVARARGHYITAPEELLLNATVRARDKGRELHGQFHFGPASQSERIAASAAAAAEPHEPPGPLRKVVPPGQAPRPGVAAAKWRGAGMDLVSQPTPSAYADAALLSHFRTPYVGPAEREAATAAAAKAARASAVAHRPLLSPRRPLPSSPRHLAPVALPVLPDGSEGLGEHEMVNARLMLGMGTGLRRTPRWR